MIGPHFVLATARLGQGDANLQQPHRMNVCFLEAVQKLSIPATGR